MAFSGSAAQQLLEEGDSKEGTAVAATYGTAAGPGRFHNMRLHFKSGGTGLSNVEQAREILRIVGELHSAGATRVGLTYSANTTQSIKIRATYADGQWKTNTSGANQANVIKQIETLLGTTPYAHLRDVFRLLPISTICYTGGGGNATVPASDIVEADMGAIETFIADAGCHVLGWQNQNTDAGYAIGGGRDCATWFRYPRE